MALVIPRPFKDRLKEKPPDIQARILRTVERLGTNPRHSGLRTHRVQGTIGVWEARVDRANRVTFHYSEGNLVLRRHCNHDILRAP